MLSQDHPFTACLLGIAVTLCIASLAPSARAWYSHHKAASSLPPQWHMIPCLPFAGWIEALFTALGVEWLTIHNLVKKPVLVRHGIARMTVVQFGTVLRLRNIVYISSPEMIEWFLATERKHPKRESQATLGSDTFGCHVFNSTGPAWSAQRRIMNPALGSTPRKSVILEKAGELVKLASTKQLWDAGLLLQRFAVDILGDTLFGIDFDAIRNPEAWFISMKRIEHILEPGLSDWLKPLQRFDPFAKTPENLAFREHQLQRMVDEVMSRRDALVPDSPQSSLIDVFAKDQLKARPVLNEARMKENLEFLFFSGHHSVTLALCHILHQLALQPSLYARAADEVSGYTVASETPPRLIRNLVLESLRFHPPIEESPDYVASENLWLPGGHFIPKGGILRFSALAAHHAEASYSSPGVFNPDRDLHNLEQKFWLPFGLGQRSCPASHLAIAILTHTTAVLIRNFSFELEGSRHSKRMHFKSFMGTEPDRLMIKFVKK